MPMNCREFLELRDEEKQLLDNLHLPPNGSVLDYGCGVGRHMKYLRQQYPKVECVGIDTCELLRSHCSESIALPSKFVEQWADVETSKFDLIMLMGNGLGVLGDELNARQMLRKLADTLNPSGTLLIEAGNPFGSGYHSPRFTIEYGEWTDDPFTWGYSDRAWLENEAKQADLRVSFHRSNAPGTGCFFADIHGC